MKEEWKCLDFMGYPNYEVSNYGDVMSETHGLMSDKRIKLGYRMVRLCKDGKRKELPVHRLVALAFVDNPNPEKYNVVNHKDENKLNNRYDNLEWCDTEYNVTYGTAIQRRSNTKYINNTWNHEQLKELNRKKVYKYDLDGNLIRTFNSVTECYNIDLVGSPVLLSDTPIKNGYIYAYNKVDINYIQTIIKLNKELEESKRIKVYKYTLDGVLISQYDDIKICDDGNINRILECCKSGCGIYKDFVWSFDMLRKEEIIKTVANIKGYLPIYRYDLNDYSICEYDNIDCIEKNFNKQMVKYCCDGTQKIHKGYLWSYNSLLKDDIKKIKYDIENLNKVKVFQYNLLGELVREWDSIIDCINAGFVKSQLHKCFKLDAYQHNGFIWSKYILDENELKDKIKLAIENTKIKPVYQYNRSMEIVNRYNTVHDAATELGISAGVIHECCRGVRKSYKGYLWSYYEV